MNSGSGASSTVRARISDTPGVAAPAPSAQAVSEARSAVALGLYVSATRCLLTYVVAPLIGALGWVLGPLGLLLQVLGAITSVAGAVRLRRITGRWSVVYAAVAAAVVIATAWALLRGIGR